jgi:hypothetical protein
VHNIDKHSIPREVLCRFKQYQGARYGEAVYQYFRGSFTLAKVILVEV